MCCADELEREEVVVLRVWGREVCWVVWVECWRDLSVEERVVFSGRELERDGGFDAEVVGDSDLAVAASEDSVSTR